MRALRHLALVLSSLLVVLFGGASAGAQSATSTLMSPAVLTAVGPHDVDCPTRNRDASTNSAPPALQEYYLDDWRLGPEQLPGGEPLASMFTDYERLGGATASGFLDCYWNSETNGWWYPDQDGFVLRDGRPVKRPVELELGQKLDLFGSGFGRFLAPAGTDYEERAIPPSNLDTVDPDYPYAYHLYEVTKPFTVDAGPIRPWFNQPGEGLQYVLNSEYIEGAPDGVRIPYLLENGYLRALN